MGINKRTLFNPVFKVQDLAGFQSRYKSLDSLLGPQPVEQPMNEGSGHIFKEDGLKAKYKTMQTPAIMPSVELRKKGKL